MQAVGEAWSEWENVGAGSRGVTVGNLVNGWEYVFEVRAVNALGKGESGDGTGHPGAADCAAPAAAAPRQRRWRRRPAVSTRGAGGPDGDARGGSGAAGVESARERRGHCDPAL